MRSLTQKRRPNDSSGRIGMREIKNKAAAPSEERNIPVGTPILRKMPLQRFSVFSGEKTLKAEKAEKPHDPPSEGGMRLAKFSPNHSAASSMSTRSNRQRSPSSLAAA